jgi:hypothetical protein
VTSGLIFQYKSANAEELQCDTHFLRFAIHLILTPKYLFASKEYGKEVNNSNKIQADVVQDMTFPSPKTITLSRRGDGANTPGCTRVARE